MKKIISLGVILFISTHVSAIVFKANAIKNNTYAPISVLIKREIYCFGKLQTGTFFSRLKEGQTGLAFLDTGGQGPCRSHATELRISQGLKTASIKNPHGIPAKDYAVSLKAIGVSGQDQDFPEEEIVIE